MILYTGEDKPLLEHLTQIAEKLGAVGFAFVWFDKDGCKVTGANKIGQVEETSTLSSIVNTFDKFMRDNYRLSQPSKRIPF